MNHRNTTTDDPSLEDQHVYRTDDIDDGLQGSQDATQHLGILFSQVLVQHYSQVTHQLLLQKVRRWAQV